MAARKRRPKGKSGGANDHWTKVIRGTMEEPAWRALTSTAQAAYPWLKLEWHGIDNNNNGKIRLSVRQLAAYMGVRPDTAAAALLGLDGSGTCAEWELTEIKLAGGLGDGRKLYRQWEPGKDFPVAATGSNNPEGRNGRK